MRYDPVNLGFVTADGEDVRLRFDGDALTLEFTDWQEKSVCSVFPGILAFRWAQEVSGDVPRDDTTFEVVDSPELAHELQVNAIRVGARYAHYKVCFNASGMLDVLCKRI